MGLDSKRYNEDAVFYALRSVLFIFGLIAVACPQHHHASRYLIQHIQTRSGRSSFYSPPRPPSRCHSYLTIIYMYHGIFFVSHLPFPFPPNPTRQNMFCRPILISALGLIKGLEPWDLHHEGEDFEFSALRSTLFIFGLISTIFLIAWHFARAWLTLPGLQLISGDTEKPPKPDIDAHGIYASGRLVVIAWCILFCSFILNEDDGFDYRGALLAWMLSLIAVFPHPVSYAWLAVTTGVFIEGIGAHRLRFLGCTEQH